VRRRGSPGRHLVFGPKYCGDDEARMQMALEEIANSGAAFWWQCASTR
jgi:hypothetical protein